MTVRPTYEGAHYAVRRLRGPARDHRCVDCGGQAREWSYSNTAPDEQTDEHGRRFSMDPDQYAARCTPCHVTYDRPRPSWENLRGQVQGLTRVLPPGHPTLDRLRLELADRCRRWTDDAELRAIAALLDTA